MLMKLYEVIIVPKFHNTWAKIVDFLLGHSDFKIALLIKIRLYFTFNFQRCPIEQTIFPASPPPSFSSSNKKRIEKPLPFGTITKKALERISVQV